jgi:hypothetical protein
MKLPVTCLTHLHELVALFVSLLLSRLCWRPPIRPIGQPGISTPVLKQDAHHLSHIQAKDRHACVFAIPGQRRIGAGQAHRGLLDTKSLPTYRQVPTDASQPQGRTTALRASRVDILAGIGEIGMSKWLVGVLDTQSSDGKGERISLLFLRREGPIIKASGIDLPVFHSRAAL